MTRAPGAGAKVMGLAALLAQPRPDVIEAQVDTIDPAEQFEQQRCSALEAARRDGYAEGMARAEKEIEAASERARQTIEQAQSAESKRLETANRRMEELLQGVSQAAADADATTATWVAEIAYAALVRFLGENGVDDALLKQVCRQALEEYRQRPVVLRVPVDEVPMLQELSADASISIEGDARLAPGQCRLQTRKGDYDTGLEVRLDAIKQAFLRSVESGGAAR